MKKALTSVKQAEIFNLVFVQGEQTGMFFSHQVMDSPLTEILKLMLTEHRSVCDWKMIQLEMSTDLGEGIHLFNR